MQRSCFDNYINRFNAKDETAFEDFLCEDVAVRNGNLEYQGVAGMKAHYALIWQSMDETLNVKDFVSDGDRVAVGLHTHFHVREDTETSPFGPVRKNETFDYEGVIFYQLKDGRFSSILVSYLDFVKTELDGNKVSLGIAH